MHGPPGGRDPGAPAAPRRRRKKLTARLDAQAGVQFEGDDQPEYTDDDNTAIRIANVLSNGAGGFDWAGVELWAGLLGVTDIEGLMLRLEVLANRRGKPTATEET